MLLSLSISNFALIEKSSMDFSKGFTIITGETGAGKSILLGALGLILGKRSDLTVLKDQEKKCIVEASFDIGNYDLRSFFETLDIDYDDNTIIRREILPNGKSRAFVNDSPVTLQDLASLGSELIDIHSQQQTRELTDEKIQIRFLDAVAGSNDALRKYREILKQFRTLGREIANLREHEATLQREYDFNKFLYNELAAVQLQSGSQQDMESRLQQLNNVGLIRENLSKVIALSNNEQIGVAAQLKEIRSTLGKLAHLSTTYELLSERMDSVSIEFDDILQEVNSVADDVLDDPSELADISSKLGVLYDLQKKHHVSTVEELIAKRDELSAAVSDTDKISLDISEAEGKLEVLKESLDKAAADITKKRKTAIPNLQKKVVGLLSGLGMPDAQFIINISEATSYQDDGKDMISFLFSANKGASPQLLKKVASGGEMSRIMLAIKAILSEYSKLPTIIFDEIDTGVSGEIANKMGEIMVAMSKHMQVFAITHLPQVAAKGNTHLKVYKFVKDGKTHSDLQILEGEDRIAEIAEMLSGKNLTDSAINHARALLK
jgi:DNA repair protein RecN (Recombination protein N)